MTHSLVAGFRLLPCLLLLTSSLFAAESGTALVRHAPSVNGTVQGNLQQMLPESSTLNGGAAISGDWLVPGMPSVRLNGNPQYGGTVDGSGSSAPSNYQITLNGNSSLAHVIRRSNAPAIAAVAAPAQPTGSRSVTINSAGQSAGNFATLRHLTLNGNVGQFAIPSGSYGDFTANGGSGFTLGVAGATEPAIYHFQRLTLNGQSQVQVLGPVIVTVANGFTANGIFGSSSNAARLTLNIYSGGFTLNGGANFYGYVNAPNGTVIVNGNSQLIGGVAADRLTVNGGGLLRLVPATAANRAPVADAQSVATDEDTSLTVTLHAADADGQALSYSIVTAPAHGSLSAAGSPGRFTYAPAANYHGSDSFTFKASDGIADSNTATVSITVRPSNDAPVAVAQSVTVREDAVVAITLTGSDVDGNALSYGIVAEPAHGSLTGTAPNLTYTPAADFHGSDSFTFTASDGAATSAAVAVTITVSPENDAPLAASRSYAVSEGSAVAITLTASDVDSDPLTYHLIAMPASGALEGTPPNLTYRPHPNVALTDTFTFKANDGVVDSNVGTISIQVTNLNDPPTALGQSVTVAEDTPATIALSGTDPDGGALVYTVVTTPVHGRLGGSGAALTYTPDLNYSGPDSFTFKVTDSGQLDSAPATVAIVVDARNDAPEATSQTVTTAEDTPAAIILSGSDIEGATLSFSIVTSPGHGTLTTGAVAGAYTYTPAANYHGADQFTFKVGDGQAESSPTTVAVTVSPTNDAPTVATLTRATAEDTAMTLTLTGSDLEGDSLTFVIVAPPTHGTLTAGTAGADSAEFVYSPAPNFHGADSFVFRASDGSATSEDTTASISIAPVNDAPVATGQTLAQPQDSTFDFTLNATDVDGDPLVYTFVSLPTHGAITGTAPNLTYTPSFNYRGSDSLVFTVSDGQVVSNQATVGFTMTPVSHAPIANAQTVTLNEDSTTVVSLTATDLDEDTLSYLIVTPPTSGTLAPGATPGSYTYSPAANFHGADSFTFKASDGALESQPVTVTLSVTSVNDAPTSSAQAVTLAEDTPTTITLIASDVDGDAIVYTVVSQPAHGSLAATTLGSFTYTPAANFEGTDSFTFKASDGALESGLATVSFTVTPVNDAPVASAQTLTTAEDTPIAIVLTGSDADQNPVIFAVLTAPAHGTFSGTAPNLNYTPAANFSGQDSFTFKVSDGTLDSGSATVSITVTPVNDAPIAVAQSLKTANDMALPITLSATDVENDPLTYALVASATNGNLTGSAPNLTYTPNVGFTGTDSFTFKASDGVNDSVTATVDISVSPPNGGPMVNAGIDQQIEFTPFSGARPRGRIVVNNDEWALTDEGFTASPFAGTFARNLADYLSGGKAGAKFLANTAVIPGSVEFIYTGTRLAAAMQAAGHVWTASSSVEMTLSNLLQYDAVFLGANNVSNRVLIDYVNAGGSVYLSAGSHWSGSDAAGEAALWNTFLNHFGLHYNSPYNGVGGTLPVTSEHPLFHGIDTLYFANGNSVSELNPENPYTEIPFTYQSHGLFGMSGDIANQTFLHGTATDDGRPAPPGALTYSWSQVSGPQPASFDAPTALTTRVHLPVSGSYTFRLTANDGEKSGHDDVTLLANMAPEVYAGADQIVRDTSQPVALVGTMTDDGVPQASPTCVWTVVSGPAGVAFGAPTSAATSATFTAAGIYTLKLTATDSVYSNYDTVEIRVGMQSLEPAAGLAAWWPLNASAAEVVSGTHPFGVGSVSFTEGKVGAGLTLSGTRSVAVAAGHPDLDVGASPTGFTVEFWVNSGSSAPLLSWADGISLHLVDGNRLGGNLREAGGANHSFDSYAWGADVMWISAGTWHHVAIAYDRVAGVMRFYQNGLLRHTEVLGSFDLATAGDFRLGSAGFSGMFDEVTLYRRPLSSAEIFAIHGAGSSGKCPPDGNAPPTVNAGANLVVAGGTSSVALAGVVTDDGQPFGTPTVSWTKVEGPGEVNFGTPSQAATTAVFGAPGNYLLRLTATDHYTLPVSDVVEVRVGGGFPEPASGLSAWWPGNGEPREVVNGNHDVELVNGASYGTGAVSQGFRFVGGGGYGRVAAHSDLDIGGAPDGFTIEFWVNSTSSATMLAWTGGASFYLFDGNRFAGNLREAGGTNHTFDTYTLGGEVMWTHTLPWHHIAVTYDRPTGLTRMYQNGRLMQFVNFGSYALATTGDLILGSSSFVGTIDELTLHKRPLQASEIAAVFAAGALGKSPPDDNTPPLVNAGADLIVASSANPVALNGSVTDDQKPFGAPIVTWSKLEGPGDVIFGVTSQPQTTATFSAPGLYLLKLTGDDRFSPPVSDVVEVRIGGGYADLPLDAAAWWPGNASPDEIVNGHHAELFNGATYASGRVGQAFRFVGAGSSARALPHADLDVGSSAAGFTVEFWVNSTSNATFLSWSGGASFYLFDGNRFAGNLREIGGTNHAFDTYTLGGGEVMWTYTAPWNHIVVAYDRPSGATRMYLNGQLKQSVNLGSFALATTGAFTIGGGTFTGLVDEVTLYRRPLSTDEVAAIYGAGALGKNPQTNRPPVVNAGADQTVAIAVAAALVGAASDDGVPNPPGALSYLWTKVSGPGNVVFSSPTATSTNATFSAGGLYTLRFTATDSVLTAFDDVDVTVTVPANLPPTVDAGADASAYTGAPLVLNGTATDDGMPNPPAALTYTWSKVSGPGVVAFTSPTSLATSATFDAAGSYTLRLTANDSVLTASDDLVVTVTAPPSTPPTVAFYEPATGAKLPASTYFELAVHATDTDGTISKVEFFQGTTKLGQQTAPAAGDPTTYFWPMTGGLAAGDYTFTAKATDNSGAVVESAPVSISVIADPGPPVAELVTPVEDARITSPTPITGAIVSSILKSWSVDYRLKAAEGAATEDWLSMASGTAELGTVALPAELGSFDPTRLINGIYEVRLTATDTAGRTATSGPITVLVEGNMKIGAFTLAFEDLKVPVAGLPITLTRTYDSRDTRIGDFGPGWRLALANIRLQKNRHLGTAWWQTPQSGDGIQFYDVLPIVDRIVTVVFPDGETHRFKAGAYVKVRDGDPDYRSFAAIVRRGKYRFYPIGDTTSKLEPVDASNQLAEDFWIAGTGDQDLRAEDPSSDPFAPTFNATRFRLTTNDGSAYLIDEMTGLLKVTDLNGNTLVPTRDTQNRVTGVTSTQNASDGPLTTSITVHRDANGRVDYIRDPAGQDIDFSYDAKGRLESVTDRVSNVTQFRYENAAFPFYLTKVIDPRGIAALRSEFDTDGKLVKQIDADGNETVFSRGEDTTGRFEKITDRRGKQTKVYYDDRGNVTLKIDPLGARTSYAYYPDSDWVKFETDHYGSVTSRAYDARGNAIVQTLGAVVTEDPAAPTTGYITRTLYNERSAPTQITDPDGRVQSFGYDPTTNDLLTHTTGAGSTAPATTTYTYLADGTLDTITDALGNVTSHTYDHSLTDAAFPTAVKKITVTVSDPAGAAGSDASNATEMVLRSTRTLYDAQENQLAQIVTRTLPDGSTEDVTTRFLYDAENRLSATIHPDGRVTETRYTSFGQESKTLLWTTVAAYTGADDTLARVTSYGYDDRGNRTSVTYADGSVETMHFDAENRKDWSEDRLGRRTVFEYDDVGRLRFTVFPDATPAIAEDNPRRETRYDLAGRITAEIDERGSTVEFTYEDGCGCAMRRREMIQKLAAGDLVTNYEYDRSGNVRFVTDPRGNRVETRYDDHGRPHLVVYPATDEHPVTQTETRYDALGRRVEVIDQEGKTTRYRYDGLGRLTQVRQYLNAAAATADADLSLTAGHASVVLTAYAYDEIGNQVSQTDALGRVTTYWTDSVGRRTKRVLPKDATESAALTETLEYDDWGNLWKRTDFAGKTTTYGYDSLNRLKSKSADATHPSLTYSHAIARIEFDYDANGARTAARTYNQSDVLLYTESTPRDERGRTDYKDAAGGQLDYDYYPNGLLKDTVSSNPGGVNVGYRYDALNRLEHVDDGTTGAIQTTSYTYNPNGSLETVTYPNTVVHTYGYDSLNRLRTLEVNRAGNGGSIHSYDYNLRASGHRRQVVEGARTITYTYDELYRLTDETRVGDANGQSGSIGYGLDKVGNRQSRTSSVSSVATVANQSFNARDWLGGDTYTANGSTQVGRTVLGEPPATDTYDFEERLIVRTKPDGSSINLGYDADGNRITKTLLNASAQTVTSTSWLADTNNLTGYAQVLEERISSAGAPAVTTTRTYTYGCDLISQGVSLNSQPSTLNFYLYDGHGSVRELTDSAGAVTDRYDYDAFGNLTFQSGATANAYRYCGEQFDGDLGLYYLRARYLNPDSGRFWSMDSVSGDPDTPASLHKYLYCAHDPIDRMDPSGHSWLLNLAISSGISGLLNVAIAWPSIHSVGDAAAEFGIGAVQGAAFFGAGSLAIKALVQFGRFISAARVARMVSASSKTIPGVGNLATQFILETPAGRFVISSGLKDGLVTGALKHVVEDIIKRTGQAGVTEMAEKLMIAELRDVLTKAAGQGIQNGVKMTVRTTWAEWELIFDATGPIARLYHAVPRIF